ncbi:hypothetical protein HI914_05336 [Erysiphe necator]|uniref:Uncharacterized protein n=1 Tax=Uncinula necator TaxID=52586 RepID=A0A0B1P6A1_UNCNE|nr:hypothetical protein HI914_05336 [Erysiphe necator]KHJ32850.1 hypothetical protein EV44_g2222 [Erysiphe necator]
MGYSLESSRPLITSNAYSQRNSAHITCYNDSVGLALTPSLNSLDSAYQEFYEIEASMQKLENKKLTTQRFIPTQEKIEFLSKLAFSAKLERALERRLIGQDAVMRDRSLQVQKEQSEKIVSAAS